ncbi:Tetratricopeptide-like helical domain [Lasallia pustulata]|uniref:Tetratricopeptide-like helical domain n=1 Tax=Lasallia pustulata TaxID=136370 RepID=A0A1W5CUT0_9LECA|nr:Tetratricopeptide-like helical domain [Lasallia pustulata]
MTKRALDLRLHRLSPDDPAIGASYGNLAMLTVSTGDYEDSLRYSELCLDIRMKNEANETENISCTYLYYGWCYARMGNMDKAEEFFKRAIGVMRDRFGEGALGLKPQTMDLYQALGREEDAYKAHLDAYMIGKDLYGPLSPRIFTSLYKLAWSMAKTLLEKMEKEAYIVHIARTQYLLAAILAKLDEEEASEELKEKASAIGKELNGPSWEPRRGEADFDQLVFFHDR